MNITYSDLNLLGGDPVKNAECLVTHGASQVELMMDGGGWDEYPSRKETLIPALKSLPVSYTLHSPCWDNNLTSENHQIRKASLASGLEAVDFAAGLGVSHLVIHPGFCQTSVFDRKQAVARSVAAIDTLYQYARDQGVCLAIENVGYNGTSLYTQEEFAHLLDPFEDAMYLIDTGHAVLNGWDIPRLIRQTAERLCALHLHDNDGVTDSHLPIGTGIIQWEPIWAAIEELPCACCLVLEYNIGISPAELQKAAMWLQRRFPAQRSVSVL